MLDLPVTRPEIEVIRWLPLQAKVVVKLVQRTISIVVSKHAAELKAKMQASQLKDIRC